MEDDKFYTGGVIHYDDLEELQNFIRQTDGLRLSEEQSNELIRIIKNSQPENVEIPTTKL